MSDTQDKTAGFTFVRQARALISGVNAALSDATRQQYNQAFSRMLKRETTPEKIANTVRAFYYYRAAWVHHYATEIRKILTTADRSQRTGDTNAWQESVSKLPSLIENLDRYRPDPEGKNLTSGLIVGADRKLTHLRPLCRLKTDPGVLLALPKFWAGDEQGDHHGNVGKNSTNVFARQGVAA